MRPVRVTLNSDWVKRDLLKHWKNLQGSQYYFKENLSRDMQNLDYHVRQAHKKGRFNNYSTRKDVVLIYPAENAVPIEVRSVEELTAVIARFKEMTAKPKSKKKTKGKNKHNKPATVANDHGEDSETEPGSDTDLLVTTETDGESTSSDSDNDAANDGLLQLANVLATIVKKKEKEG